MTVWFREAERREAIARLWSELLVAGRFGLVGVVATLVHMLVVWRLIETTDIQVLLANFFAFLTAFGVSFAGNYLWTFGAPGSPARAMRRFFVTSLSAFATNSILLAALTASDVMPPVVAAVSAALVIPLITFLASRFWAFREGRA